MDVLHHFARAWVATGKVRFEYVSSDAMAADGPTEALTLPNLQAGRRDGAKHGVERRGRRKRC